VTDPPGRAGAAPSRVPRVGVLALQGDFEAHARLIRALGAEPVEVRTAPDLEDLDGLILPGGESTVMALGIEREGLERPLRALAAAGTPVFGTCAGLIMLDREHLDVLDVVARRNAFGRQIRSFEADLDVAGLDGGPVRGVFIRAPWVEQHGEAVEVLAALDGHPVAVRQRDLMAVAFHPELAGDTRLHELFLAAVRRRMSDETPVARKAGVDSLRKGQ
jgi:5'-phosphate synthase pdxT subunit